LTDQVASTLAARHDRYLEVADLQVDAARAVDEVADEILSWAMSSGDVLTPSEYEQVMT
jgi:hypothetical protein